MNRRGVVLSVAVVLVFAGVWYANREFEEHSPLVPPVAKPAADTAPVVSAPPPAAQVTPSVEQLVADAAGADAQRRTTALAALATAPRAQALPVLSHALTNGEPGERPLALRSLRELALAQGDADGAIRAAIREAIYHGDDEALSSAAQDALSVVETAETK